ncbi:MAG: helix-turn-helix domain-containing protein [Candidatus Saccharimonadales bacterium]
MKLLGDYWTLRILDALRLGDVRFCELQRIIDNVNPVTLTTRLKKLEDARLIIRTPETKDKISVSYSLSELGQEVIPVIRALDHFSSKVQASLQTTDQIIL